MTVRPFGLRCGKRSWSLTSLTTAVGLLWLAYPLIRPMWVASQEQSVAEAPLVLALMVTLVGLCWVALWVDSGQELTGLGFMAAAVIINTALRSWLNAGSGVEVNYVLPLLVGAAAGGPAGFIVGATSCIVSQFASGLVEAPLPGQIVVWGIAGLLGGLVHRLRLGWAWAWCLPLGVLFGVLAGVLLNLIGWPTSPDDGSSSAYFFPALSGWTNAGRLLRYSWETSFGYDLARGIATATGVLVVGLPIVAGLRRICAPGITADAVIPPARPGPTHNALSRRARARLLEDRWNDTSQENS